MTSRLISADASVELLPLDQAQAQQIMHDWLLGWLEGLKRPLPVAAETAFALLTEKKPEQQLFKAASCYDGSSFLTGEVSKSVALQRSYPDFAGLLANEEFQGWAEALYQPLVDGLEGGWITISAAAEGEA